VFDELYAEGKKANDAMKEAHGAFHRDDHLHAPDQSRSSRAGASRWSVLACRAALLRPDVRSVLIDGNTMTMVWPSRGIRR